MDNASPETLNGFAVAAGRRLEYYWTRRPAPGETVLVFLHEGLGSAALWRDFPQRLSAVCGLPALVYSRYGYGQSAVLAEKRPVDYMHHEALVALPELLAALDIDAPILVGHSDGGSIALIHAGAGRWPVRGVIVEAPHVFVEDLSIASIEDARAAYQTTELPQRLGRHHADGDRTFWGWNDIWLDPAFRSWNIEDYLPAIACPVLAIQGEDDEYGTPAQVDAVARQAGGPAQVMMLPDCRHAPHRDQAEAVLAAMAGFVAKIAG